MQDNPLTKETASALKRRLTIVKRNLTINIIMYFMIRDIQENQRTDRNFRK